MDHRKHHHTKNSARKSYSKRKDSKNDHSKNCSHCGDHSRYRDKDSSNKNLQNKKSSDTLYSNTSSQVNKIADSKFEGVSLILINDVDRILIKDNSYQVMFNSGILEGSGITVNKSGSEFTFHNEGSYMFELIGDIVEDIPEGEIKVVFHSDQFKDDIRPFNETILHRKNEQYITINNSKCILPINNNQTISVKIIPENSQPIGLLKGSKLHIYRVA